MAKIKRAAVVGSSWAAGPHPSLLEDARGDAVRDRLVAEARRMAITLGPSTSIGSLLDELADSLQSTATTSAEDARYVRRMELERDEALAASEKSRR